MPKAGGQVDLVHEMFETAEVGLAILDPDLRIVRVNRAFAELSGLPRAAHIGASLEDVIPSVASYVGSLAGRVLETGQAVSQLEIKGQMLGREGETIRRFVSCSPLHDGERVAGVGVRIHQAESGVEDALRAHEARFRAICDASPVGIFLADEKGKNLYSNPVNLAQMGLTREEALGGGWERAIHPEDRVKVREDVDAMTRSGSLYHRVGRYVHRDGRVVLVDVKARRIQDGDRVIGYVGMAEDITARTAAEAALRESELRFRELAENIRSVFWLRAADRSKIYYLSPVFEEIYGRSVEEAKSRPNAFVEAVHPDDRERVLAQMHMPVEKADEYEYRICRPDGSIAWIHDRRFPVRDETGQIVRVAGIATDVTAQKILEAQLLQASKLDSLGRLAGGVAHDFNNMLTVILNQGIMGSRSCDAGEMPRAELAIIQDAAKQATEVTRQLLAFARRQAFDPALLDPNALVETIARFLSRLLGAHVELRLSLAPDIGILRGDRAQLEQVIVNLALNARDAMPDGGKLSIRTGNVDVSPGAREGGVPCGAWVVLVVEDTGRGISIDDRAHIFEPFFSTKSPGEGTGLGLATCYGIVKQHGGHVLVQSTVGRGTTFELYFPRLDGGYAQVAAAQPEHATEQGTEMILVVEDEPNVRASAVRTLSQHGFTVLEACDGADAVRLLARREGRVDLVFTDVLMPKVDGAELGTIIREKYPSLRVLYTSGYPHGTDLRAKDGTAVPFLAKPYLPSALLRSVRDVLDAR